MSNIDPLESLPPLMDAVPRLQAQSVLHMGHNKLYGLLRRGELEAVKDGPRTLITIDSIRRYQANRPRATFQPPAPTLNNFHTLKRKRPRLCSTARSSTKITKRPRRRA
jgi:hypothetical protein